MINYTVKDDYGIGEIHRHPTMRLFMLEFVDAEENTICRCIAWGASDVGALENAKRDLTRQGYGNMQYWNVFIDDASVNDEFSQVLTPPQ